AIGPDCDSHARVLHSITDRFFYCARYREKLEPIFELAPAAIFSSKVRNVKVGSIPASSDPWRPDLFQPLPGQKAANRRAASDAAVAADRIIRHRRRVRIALLRHSRLQRIKRMQCR